jgi:hypothetical protein
MFDLICASFAKNAQLIAAAKVLKFVFAPAAKVLKFVFARRFSRKNTQLITVAANFKYTGSCAELIV